MKTTKFLAGILSAVIAFTAAGAATAFAEEPPAEAGSATITLEQQGESNSGIYDIVLTPDGENTQISNYRQTELTFEMKKEVEGAVPVPKYEPADSTDYEVTAANGHELRNLTNGKFGFYKSDSENISSKTTIGTIRIVPDCEYTLKITVGLVRTQKIGDSLVDSYHSDKKTVDGAEHDGNLTFSYDDVQDAKNVSGMKTNAKYSLTVNVTFPNEITNAPKEYTDMGVTISGMGQSPIVAKLGTPATRDNLVRYKEPTDGKPGMYTIEVPQLISGTYSVTFAGDGYRTYTAQVNLNNDKTVTVWNNVLDTAKAVVTETPPAENAITDPADSAATDVTFLAGDIVLDKSIDIYDLSAVMSYFGVDPTQEQGEDGKYKYKYVRYDLNRDGSIDSRDIAMVLVSWGK